MGEEEVFGAAFLAEATEEEDEKVGVDEGLDREWVDLTEEDFVDEEVTGRDVTGTGKVWNKQNSQSNWLCGRIYYKQSFVPALRCIPIRSMLDVIAVQLDPISKMRRD